MKRALCAVAFGVALVICLIVADKVMRREDSTLKYSAFYEEQQPFDVFFLGTSHAFDGVFPMELWRDYGITSYNLGNSSEPLEMTEWVLRIATQTQVPKVAMIDVYYVDRTVTDEWAYSFRHLFLDAVPLSPIKVQAVMATLPSDMWAEFLFPFILYHGRWDEMIAGTTELTVDTAPCMMGAEMRIGRGITPEFTRTTAMNTEDMPGKQAIRRIVALCRELGIEPVLTCIPAPIDEQEQMNVNSVLLIADELGVPYINMLDVPGLVDYDTDCYDELGHLNPDGALKVTAYLGQWLEEHIELDDKRDDPAYTHWNARLETYDALLAEKWGDMTLLGEK